MGHSTGRRCRWPEVATGRTDRKCQPEVVDTTADAGADADGTTGTAGLVVAVVNRKLLIRLRPTVLPRKNYETGDNFSLNIFQQL